MRTVLAVVALAALVGPGLPVSASPDTALAGSSAADARVAADPLPRVPPGFAVTVHAHVGGLLTALSFGPDTRSGEDLRLYATDYANGRVLTLDPDLPGAAETFADGFTNPLGIAVDDEGVVYVADSQGAQEGPFGDRSYGQVWRVQDTDGDGAADERAVVIRDLPNGRHSTNGLVLGDDGLLYITNGNATDDGVEGGAGEVVPWSGAIIRVDPASTDVSLADLAVEDALVATGMRNLYDLSFAPADPGLLLTAMNGTDDAREGSTGGTPVVETLESSDDLLYATRVDDDTVEVDPETGERRTVPVIDDFGFPSCLYHEARRGDLEPYDNPNPAVIDAFGPCPTSTVPRPLSSFGAHVSANGLDFQRTDAWGEAYQHDLFVAEFGNFFGDEVVGHRVVRVSLDGDGVTVRRQSDFLSGALPLALRFSPDGALFVGDFSGALYRVDRVVEVPSVVDVAIAGFQFVPQVLVVPQGMTVRWTNEDTVAPPHVVAGQVAVRTDGSVDDGDEMSSGVLGVGQRHEHRFDDAGTWKYTCTINALHEAAMHATVVVVPAGS